MLRFRFANAKLFLKFGVFLPLSFDGAVIALAAVLVDFPFRRGVTSSQHHTDRCDLVDIVGSTVVVFPVIELDFGAGNPRYANTQGDFYGIHKSP